MITPQAKIGIIQLTRTGDLIQTTQAVENLKQEQPHIKTVLYARKQYASGIMFLLKLHFDEIILIDQIEITRSSSLSEAKDKVINQLKLNEFKLDVLINLSFSKTSSFLSSIIPSRHKLGLTRDDSDNLIVKDTQSQYIYTNVLETNLNPFNLVDLYRNIIGLKNVNEKYLKIDSSKRHKLIVHPFSSNPKKNWSPIKWGQFLTEISRYTNISEIHIVGSSREAKESEIIMNNRLIDDSITIINHTGKTSISQLYELIDNNTVFIGHDSMVSHICSYKRIPTIVISLGPVRPHETTAYGVGNYTLSPSTNCFPCNVDTKCADLLCHNDIPPKLVAKVVDIISSGKVLRVEDIEDSIPSFLINKTKILGTTLSNESGQSLVPLNESNSDINEIFREIYKISWSFILNDRDANCNMPSVSDKTISLLTHYLKPISSLFELNDFGKTYCEYILKEANSSQPSINKIKDLNAKLQEIDEYTYILKKTYTHLAPLINFYHVKKQSIEGNNLYELTQNLLVIYHDFNSAVAVVFNLLQNIIDSNKSKMNQGKNTNGDTKTIGTV